IETVEEFAADYDNPHGEFRGFANSGFDKQFEGYLNGENITSSKAEYKEAYLNQAASLEKRFNVWMQQHPDIQELTDQFNRQFNSFVPVEYEGESLGIDDCLSGEISPHSYQNAEVRRLSEQGSGICGFGVGLGKSFTALAMAAYNKKRGRSKRTCIVVPSAVLENWYHESRQFYNETYLRKNALFVGLEPKTDKDGVIQRKEVLDENGKPKMGRNGQPVMQDIVIFRNSKEDIHEDMWKIPQSNFSLVIMTKEKFASIPLRPSTKVAYTREMVSRSLMSEKKAAEIVSGKKAEKGKKSYAEDKALANIEAKYSDEGTRKKQELPYLEDMGFDSIIVDEAHYFKNSVEPGEHTQGIAYLPTAPAAQIAVDMAIKSHYLRSLNNGRGVYGLTATPVTNSPFEIFNMLSLVCPISEFERFGVYTVDDFVRVFGKIETVDKLTVSNDIKAMPGLVGFQNLDGLRNLFHKYVNVKTVKDVDGEIHVPEADEQEESVPMNEEQTSLYETLRKRAKEAAKSRKKGSIFSIIRDMDRLTTDIDMFERTMTFVFQSKDRMAVQKLTQSLPDEYDDVQTDPDTKKKYTVKRKVTFSMEESGDDTFTLVVPDVLEEHIVTHFKECGIIESEVAHPITPKYAKMMENLRKHFDAGGKQIIFTEEKTQHQKIRRIIVHHLPVTTDQIGIINADDASGDKLDKISKSYNAGSIRIVIANKKAEVGVNLQKGTTAIHHLTLPWTPASINQRNGRGVRQGNTVESVAVYYY
ncbi:MAG: DEAD/DEAH box helicase family protein, partial [Desulfovibrionaceae bacterium]|nr:DEAD/DEAH box helicase family protein [Desulfovibrionaceae bacterium]